MNPVKWSSYCPKFLWPIFLFLAGFLLYHSCFSIKPFGDNLQLVHIDLPSNPFHFFLNEVPECLSYRPIHATLSAMAQKILGTYPVLPFNLLKVFCHCLVAILVYFISLDIGFRRSSSFLSSFIFLFAQANVMAVGDNLSHVFGTLFGSLSIWAAFRYLFKNTRPISAGIICLSSYALSLWSKETSIAYLGLIAVLVLVSVFLKKASIKKALAILLPVIALTVVYTAIHYALPIRQPGFGKGVYHFNVGINIAKNAAMLYGSALMPFSSVKIFMARQSSHLFLPVAGAIIVFGLAVVLWPNFRKSRMHRNLLLLSLLSVLPVIMLNHVSELYTYSLMPFVALMLGDALVGFAKKSVRWQKVVIAACGVLIIINGHSVNTKLAHLAENGERAKGIVDQMEEKRESLPKGSSIVLHNRENTPGYSIFTLPDFDVIKNGVLPIKKYLKREDLNIYITGKNDASLDGKLKSAVYFSLEKDTLKQKNASPIVSKP